LFTTVRCGLKTYGIIMSGEEASAGDKPNFAGKYVLVRNENFDDFLAANGMTPYCWSFWAVLANSRFWRGGGPVFVPWTVSPVLRQ